MTRPYSPPVLFIRSEEPKVVPPDAKYFYNANGAGKHQAEPQGTLIQVAKERPDLSMGVRYDIVHLSTRTVDDDYPDHPEYAYTLTEFDFGAPQVFYEPMWATKETAQAFGMTLLRDDESVEIIFDGLVTEVAKYGLFAGHQSPYIGKDRKRELLTVNATDLEFRQFPHVFCSLDPDGVPLVVSVARYRAARKEIYLADLWLNGGECLYVPPKTCSDEYVDMHNDRNSARACWGIDGKVSLRTQTTLVNSALFGREPTKPHYYAEKQPTVHSAPV